MRNNQLKLIAFALMLALALPVFARYSKDLEKRAKKGDFDAQIELAEAYLKGDGVGLDEKKGVKTLEKAIKKGNVEAIVRLAEYYTPKVVFDVQIPLAESKIFKKKALPLYEQAAKAGNPKAISALVDFYNKGVTGTKRYSFSDPPSDKYVLGDKMPYYIVEPNPGKVEALLIEIASKGGVNEMKCLAEFYKNLGNMNSALAWMKKAADTNDPDAVYEYAYLLLETGQTYNGYDYLRKALDLGKTEAAYPLAVREIHNNNIDEAVRLLSEAADENSSAAMLLTHIYMNPDYKDFSVAKAYDAYKKCTKVLSDEDVYYFDDHLAQTLPYGLNTPLSKYEDFARVAELENANDTEGICAIANKMYNGKNYAAAVAYYSLMDKMGSPKGSYGAGLCYDNGWGVAKDEKRAFQLYKKAVDMGYELAETNYANFLFNGRGTEKDEKKAFEISLKQAQKGDALAQFNVGYSYDTGRGVTKNEAKAIEWYKKAADQGEGNAMFNLGIIAENKGNLNQALDWFSKANKAEVDGAWKAWKRVDTKIEEKKLADEFVRLLPNGLVGRNAGFIQNAEEQGIVKTYDARRGRYLGDGVYEFEFKMKVNKTGAVYQMTLSPFFVKKVVRIK